MANSLPAKSRKSLSETPANHASPDFLAANETGGGSPLRVRSIHVNVKGVIQCGVNLGGIVHHLEHHVLEAVLFVAVQLVAGEWSKLHLELVDGGTRDGFFGLGLSEQFPHY
jgi:hypothetical protein